MNDISGSPAPIDPVGLWYAVRARYGIDDPVYVGLRVNGDGTAPQTGAGISWSRVPHREADGIGALARVLASRGIDPGELPRCREARAPGVAAVLRAAWRHRGLSACMDSGRPRWRTLDAARAGDAHDRPPQALFFTAREREVLAANARRAGTGESHWLLWCGDRALRDAGLLDAASPARWVFPVNLRGAVRRVHPHANHGSGVILGLRADDSAADLRARVRQRLLSREHWWRWWLLNAGRVVGAVGVRVLYRLGTDEPGAFAGSWTDLGHWAPPGGQRIAGVACTAPGSPAYPVALGTIDWHGVRSIACRVHPVIDDTGTRGGALLAAWRRRAIAG